MDWTGLRGRTGANRKVLCRWGNFFFRPVKDIENTYALSNSFKHYAGGGQYFLNLFRCAGAATRGLDRFKHREGTCKKSKSRVQLFSDKTKKRVREMDGNPSIDQSNK